jgi:hypothetical protein
MSGPSRGVLLLILGGILIFVAFIVLLDKREKAPTPFSRIPASRGTANPAQDQLMALPDQIRIFALATIVKKNCVGTRAFFMGMASNHNAYWSVACANGKSYEVEIAPDANGSTAVLDCTILRRAKINCFERLRDQ